MGVYFNPGNSGFERMLKGVSDFHEYTMLEPGEFAPYTGFTEEEEKKVHGCRIGRLRRSK